MTLQLEHKNRLSLNVDDIDSGEETYTLPVLPKLCSVANVVAAMLACLLAVLVSIANSRTNIDIAVLLSKLMFWFVTGAVVAFLSASADYAARLLYKRESRSGASFWKFGEVVDCTAVAMALASGAVFCWGVWRAYTALRGIDVHF
jgi:hypothetical protein